MSAADTMRIALYGNPPSDSYMPDRNGVINATQQIEDQISNLFLGITSYSTVSQLPTSTGSGHQYRVYADSNASNNTYWIDKPGGNVIDNDLIASLSALSKQYSDSAKASSLTASNAALVSLLASYIVNQKYSPTDRNLYDPTAVSLSTIVNANNGSAGGAGGFTTTDYIFVGNGNYFTADAPVYGDSNNYGPTYFSKYGNATSYVSGVLGAVAAGTPMQAKADFVRLSFNISDTNGVAKIQITIGQNSSIGYRSFGTTDEATSAVIANRAVRMSRPVVFNLFVPQDVTQSIIVNQDGSTSGSGQANSTNYFAVEPGVPITPNYEFFKGNGGVGFAWYDRHLNPIGGTANQGANVSVIPPPKAAFGRTSFFKTQRNIQITSGVLSAGTIVVGWDDVTRHKPWAGKNIVTDGDSIMAGAVIGGFPLWAQDIAGNIGATLSAQLAFNGARMDQVLNSASQATFAGVDLYVLAVGTNSFATRDPNTQKFVVGRALGTLGDTSAAQTFYGDMHGKFIETLGPWIKANGGTMKQAMFTPMKRFDDVYASAAYSDGNPVNNNGNHLSDFADAMKTFGRAAGIAVLDLFADGPINSFSYNAVTVEGLHPNQQAYFTELDGRASKFLESLR